MARAWSTSKVPVLVTLMRHREQQHLSLTPVESADATSALEESDNEAIEALFTELEQTYGGLVPASEAVQETLRQAGDEKTRVNTAPNDEGFTTYGQTQWSLESEVIFYRSLARGCLLDAPDTDFILGRMRNVIPAQRWGAGAAGYPLSVPLAFKGGWGPDPAGRYQVRQTAIVGAGGGGYVLSMLALPASGSFADGTSMLSAIARWARQHLILQAGTPTAHCSNRP